MVRMKFPGLPEDQTITVSDRAVPTYERSGWQVIDPPAEPTETPTAAPSRKRPTRKETG